MPKSVTGRQVLAALPREGSTGQPGFYPLCPCVTLRTPLLHSCCWCLFPAPRVGPRGSKYPFFMGSPALLFFPWLLPPLQRDTHSFAVGACHLHAGAQLPRDAASGARGGCARSSQLPGFYSSSFASCFWKIITPVLQHTRKMQTPACRR